MLPTTCTFWEELMFVISAGRGVVFSFSRRAWDGSEAADRDGEEVGASKGLRSFSLPSQRKVVGLYHIPLTTITC